MRHLLFAALFFSLPVQSQVTNSFLDVFDPASFFSADDGRLTDSFRLIRSSKSYSVTAFPTAERTLQFLIVDEGVESELVLRGFRQHMLARMTAFPVKLEDCAYEVYHIGSNGRGGGSQHYSSAILGFDECSVAGADGQLVSFQLNYSTLSWKGVFRAILVTETEPQYIGIYQYEYKAD